MLPNDGQNAFIFGLSKSRLIIALLLFIIAVFFIGLTVFALSNSKKSQVWILEKLDTRSIRNFIIVLTMVLFFIVLVVLNIPDKYLGGFIAINDRIHPALVWILLTCGQILIGIIFFEINKSKNTFSGNKTLNIPAIVALVTLLAIWLVIAITGLGLNSANTFWSKIGVPILFSGHHSQKSEGRVLLVHGLE